MKTQRTIHKTMRITPEILDFIQSQPGDTLNDKINNAFEYIIFEQENKVRQIEFLDLQIQRRREALQQLDDILEKVREELRYL